MGSDDPFFRWANYGEAALWIVLGLVCAGFAYARRGPLRRCAGWAAIGLVLFGGSDIVEVQTGAWWRPWWLLVWKAGCIGLLLWTLWGYLRVRRSG